MVSLFEDSGSGGGEPSEDCGLRNQVDGDGRRTALGGGRHGGALGRRQPWRIGRPGLASSVRLGCRPLVSRGRVH